MSTQKSLSLVIPVFNEAENLPELLKEIVAAVAPLGRAWEVVFIDDASTDTSLDIIKGLAKEQPEVRFLSFTRNCGQSAGFKAGFDAAKNDLVVTMDADLQNDPADIPAMLEKYDQGFDMVIGWRRIRQDSFMKRIGSRIGNGVRNRLTREEVHDTGCSLKVMDAAMARRLPMFRNMHRFLPTLMKMLGARVAEVKVNHRPRRHGTSKYGTWDRLKAGVYDLFAVRWMQRRWLDYEIREQG
jgi:glycosyltransferase involved in cell wall biosynthesis